MRLPLDECAPRRLRHVFSGHTMSTIERAGYKGFKDGALLQAAFDNFDVLVTVDKNIQYQQIPENLPMAVLILSARSNRYESVLQLIPSALLRLETLRKNEIAKVGF